MTKLLGCLRALAIILLLGSLTLTPVMAQSANSSDKLRVIAEKIEVLMKEMAKKAADDEKLAKELAERKANIKQADQNISNMIARLSELTKNMDDKSSFRIAIKDFEKETLDLIAQAESSNDDAMKSGIPQLRQTLNKLKAADDLRSTKVQEARAVIRNLEDNKTRIVFFYKAGQLQKAADQLLANAKAYASIVDGARSLADSVISNITAR